MILRVAVFLVVVSCTSLWSSPATAQRFPDPDPFDEELPFDDGLDEPDGPISTQLGVKVILTDARGGDAIELYDVGDLRGSYEYDLARSVGDAFDVERSKSDVISGDYELFDGYEVLDGQPYDIRIELEDRLVEQSADEWVFVASVDKLLRTVENYGYDGVALTVCAAHVPVVYASTRVADDIDDDRCRHWEEVMNGDTVTITERPRTSAYWLFAGALLVSVALLSILTWISAGWLRRSSLQELTTTAVTVSLCVLFAGVACSTTAMIVFAVMDRPFTDFVLAYDLDATGSFVAVVTLAILTGIPFVVAASRLLGAPPPVAIAMPGSRMQASPVSTAAGPGVPSWLAGSSSAARPGPNVSPWPSALDSSASGTSPPEIFAPETSAADAEEAGRPESGSGATSPARHASDLNVDADERDGGGDPATRPNDKNRQWWSPPT